MSTTNLPQRTSYNGGAEKPKQIKSRSGCATCKQKRLKCDETKPTCLQCQKRNVDCAGYQKDFKWRSFGETKARAKPNTARSAPPVKSSTSTSNDTFMNFAAAQRAVERSYSTANDGGEHDRRPGQHDLGLVASNHCSPSSASPADAELSPVGDGHDMQDVNQSQDSSTFTRRQDVPSLTSRSSSSQHMSLIARSLAACTTKDSSANNTRPPSSANPNTKFSISGGDSAIAYISRSPQYDMVSGRSMENFFWQSPSPVALRAPVFRVNTSESLASDADECGPLDDALSFAPPTITARGQINGDGLISPDDPMFDLEEQTYVTTTIPTRTRPNSRHLSPTASTPAHEIILTEQELMLKFESQTCGILSVVEGPMENPWRSLVQPMARECPALYHAILSMAAFHGAHDDPSLHNPGMAHMAESMRCLAGTLHEMPLDYALATSLALSFSEGWDSHVSTGVQHLRAASVMVKNILIRHRQDLENGQVTNEGADRVRFLCNTFVYMDVIARLTSFQDSSDIDLEDLLITVNGIPEDEFEVDPLMGCAITLFPLISRVANLVQRVYKTESNSLMLVSTAMELKEQIERWQAPNPSSIQKPEDATLEVQHLIQTAEAYRYAALLYLHQAVPELPSESAEKLAKKVLYKLASVPLSSGAILVQIFPLFAASCEITDPEDRGWVINRWTAMTRRLKIGNMKSCWGVVQELWSRRDVAETEKANRVLRRNQARGLSTSSSAIEIPLSLKRKVSTIDEANERNVVYKEAGRGNSGEKRSNLSGLWASDSGDLAGNMNHRRSNASSNPQLEYEYTVRGSLHWLGVMADWRWEVFL